MHFQWVNVMVLWVMTLCGMAGWTTVWRKGTLSSIVKDGTCVFPKALITAYRRQEDKNVKAFISERCRGQLFTGRRI
jgi:hypothetical protein